MNTYMYLEEKQVRPINMIRKIQSNCSSEKEKYRSMHVKLFLSFFLSFFNIGRKGIKTIVS